MKITITLQSPMMIGNRKLHNRYQKSLDYIPGSVLRAAYARAIVDRCPINERVNAEKRYWVEYQDKEDCKKCKQLELCKQFSSITFPALYPNEASVFPMTARRCKYPSDNCENPVIDTLILMLHKANNLELKGTHVDCDCGASYEKIEGFHRNGHSITVPNHPITKTAINSNLRKSKDEALYTLDVLSEKYANGNDILSTTFSGEINESQDIFNGIHSLRVGAKITSGLGKCQVTYGDNSNLNQEENLEQRLSNFNICMDDHEYTYISVDLITDAYLRLEDSTTVSSNSKRPQDSDYLNALNEVLIFPFESEIVFANHRQEPYRGWDTSSTTENRRNMRLVTKAGSVFVLKVQTKNIDLNKLLEYEIRGIGDLRQHGFGKIQLCNSFHVDFRGGQGYGK